MKEVENVCIHEHGDCNWTSAEFLQMEKNKLTDLRIHMERYCNVACDWFQQKRT